MSRSFTSAIWGWDLDRSIDKLRAIYSLGNSLEPLVLSQQEQYDTIPDCAFCELYFPFRGAYEAFLKELLLRSPLDLQASLAEIDRTFDELLKLETTCFNRDILKDPQWDTIRRLASRSLEQMEWQLLVKYHDYLDTKF